MCQARDLPADIDLYDMLAIASHGTQHFVAYRMPTYAGEIEPTLQWINWEWYAPTAVDEARALMQISGRSLTPHALETGALPALWSQCLTREIDAWPAWIQLLIDATTRHDMIAPHPVDELAPASLCDRRVALVGDCAHLASPITGAGARAAFTDALALGEALRTQSRLSAALDAYVADRFGAVSELVAHGQRRGATWRAG